MLTHQQVAWLQVVWDVSVLHLRREGDDFVREGIDVLRDLSEEPIHYVHEFFLLDLVLPANAAHNAHGDQFGLAGLVYVVKVRPLYRECLGDNSYELLSMNRCSPMVICIPSV